MHEQKTASLIYGTRKRCKTCLCMCRDFTDFAHVQNHCRSLFCGMSAQTWGISLKWHGSRVMKICFGLKGGQCFTPLSIKYGNNFQRLAIPFLLGRVSSYSLSSPYLAHECILVTFQDTLSRQDRERTLCLWTCCHDMSF